MPKLNLKHYAKKCLPLIDLTSLNEDDDESVIKQLCKQAVTPHGSVAAVCIYPRFVKLARKLLNNTQIKIATVSNFPVGMASLVDVVVEIENALTDGADEVDVVMPYHELLHGNKTQTARFIRACRDACKQRCLKVILETGALTEAALITTASEIAIAMGANFIKTSTGRFPVGATFNAAEVMLRTIAAYPERAVGFKVSGGVRSIEQAAAYMQLAESMLGKGWLSPGHFRIGASSLLLDVLRYL